MPGKFSEHEGFTSEIAEKDGSNTVLANGDNLQLDRGANHIVGHGKVEKGETRGHGDEKCHQTFRGRASGKLEEQASETN